MLRIVTKLSPSSWSGFGIHLRFPALFNLPDVATRSHPHRAYRSPVVNIIPQGYQDRVAVREISRACKKYIPPDASMCWAMIEPLSGAGSEAMTPPISSGRLVPALLNRKSKLSRCQASRNT